MTHQDNQKPEITNNYIHAHQTCQKCGGCIFECEHRTKWVATSTGGDAQVFVSHPKPTQAEDGELLMLLEKYKEDIKYLHHQIKDENLTPDEILAKEDVLTNQAKRKILALKSTWQAEVWREMLGKVPEKRKTGYCETEWDWHGEDNYVRGFNQAIDLMRERLEK